MSFARILGAKTMEQASQWFKPAATFGASAGIVGLYFTDWRVIVEYIPFYNSKFKSD